MLSGGNRKKRWYDWIGLMPSRVVRILLVLSIIPVTIAFILGSYAWRASQFDLQAVVAPLDNCVAYDQEGNMIGPISDESRVSITRADMPDNLVKAFIAREDEDFYDHGGIVYLSMLRSMLKNISSWSFAQGGSTLTMQLARNSYELRSKTIDRKILEMAIARRIESTYNKDTILTAYLNRIYFGQHCYGIAQAARTYFGKRVNDLTIEECATLAGLVRGPSLFNPITNKEAAIRERNDTLDRMQECRFITEEACNRAKSAPMTVKYANGLSARSYPILWVGEEFEKLSGDKEVETSSIKVITSFDLSVQREVERQSETKMRELEASPLWKGIPQRKDDMAKGCVQVAVLCLQSKTGNVLGTIGGRCPLDNTNRWEKLRNPGALFLPIVNLAAADKGANIIRNTGTATGKYVGYRRTIELARAAGVEGTLPSSNDLYEGIFPSSMKEMVRAILRIQQRGKNLPITAIRQIATDKNQLVYSFEEFHQNIDQEVLPREATRIVASLPPFEYGLKTRLTTMSVDLPDFDGFVAGVMGKKNAVFVWIGFDSRGEEYLKKKGITRLLRSACSDLASTIFEKAQERSIAKDSPKKAEEKPEATAPDPSEISLPPDTSEQS